MQSSCNLLFKLFPLALVTLALVVLGTPWSKSHSLAFQESNVRQIQIQRKNNHPVAIKQIRNAQSDHFLQDVEIEIKNLTNKPIYYVRLNMRFPDIEVEPKRYYGFSLYYGDIKFDRIAELASPQDQPIPPGGTTILKVPNNIWEGFEGYKSDKHLSPALTNKVEIRLEEVSFGDGTGYEYGKPYPRIKTSGKNLSAPAKSEITAKRLLISPDDLHRVSFIPPVSSFSSLKKTL